MAPGQPSQNIQPSSGHEPKKQYNWVGGKIRPMQFETVGPHEPQVLHQPVE